MARMLAMSVRLMSFQRAITRVCSRGGLFPLSKNKINRLETISCYTPNKASIHHGCQ